jgi:hypothetical protein
MVSVALLWAEILLIGSESHVYLGRLMIGLEQ